MVMKSETKNILIDVGVVALGGVVNMAAEYVTLKYVSQASVPIGAFNVNAGDAVGLGSAVAEVAIGMKLKKYRVILFGAGGLAASLATIVAKALIAYSPTTILSVAPMSISTMRYSVAPASTGIYR